MNPINLPLMTNNITRADLDAVIAFLANDIPILTQSRQVQRFEEEWSRWLGVRYSVFVNSGSSANFITMAMLKEHFGEGEILVPCITWVSDIVSVIKAGLKPVFVDINKRNLGMDEADLLSKITPQTRAVFLTHILGFNALSANMLAELRQRNIMLVEDVCESHGATFQGKKLGTFGEISNFSFYYAHHLSTIEGGMVCTNNEKFYQWARIFRSHGMVRESTSDDLKNEYIKKYPEVNPEFIFAFPANNFRSTELNAVIGLSQLPRLDHNNLKRQQNFSLFLKLLDSEKYITNFEVEGSCNYAFVLILKHDDPDFCQRVMAALREARVEFRRGTSGGGNQLRQPYLRSLFPAGYYTRFPNAEWIHCNGFYIGNYPELEQSKIEKLCQLLNSIPFDAKAGFTNRSRG